MFKNNKCYHHKVNITFSSSFSFPSCLFAFSFYYMFVFHFSLAFLCLCEYFKIAKFSNTIWHNDKCLKPSFYSCLNSWVTSQSSSVKSHLFISIRFSFLSFCILILLYACSSFFSYRSFLTCVLFSYKIFKHDQHNDFN